jgi:hypothetical protein
VTDGSEQIVVSDSNVDIYTAGLPPHIAALPDNEQGPALLEAILERKKRA